MYGIQHQTNEAASTQRQAAWLPAELINTVWEFRADPRCGSASALDGRRFPAEQAPRPADLGCQGKHCRCGFQLVL